MRSDRVARGRRGPGPTRSLSRGDVLGSPRMALKDKLMSEGMKLAANPAVAKLHAGRALHEDGDGGDEHAPAGVNALHRRAEGHFAKAMGLATHEEVRDLKRTVAGLIRALARLLKSLSSSGTARGRTRGYGGRPALSLRPEAPALTPWRRRARRLTRRS